MDKLTLYYKNQFEFLLSHISNAKELKEDDIHQLRVDIKKIRSLLLLIDALESDSELVSKLLKQLRTIYKCAGKLRAIQICTKIVLEYNQNQKELIETLGKNKEQASINLLEALEKFNVDKFQNRVEKLLAELKQFAIADVVLIADRIIHDELDLIYKLWASARGENNYHDIRKFFKIIKTLLQLLLNLDANPELEREEKIVNETESVLGNWHDRDILDQRLSEIFKTSANREFKTSIREVKNKNRTEKNVLIKEFKQLMISQFIKR